MQENSFTVVMPMTTNIGADHALRVGTGPGDLSEEEAYELTIRESEEELPDGIPEPP
jgi:hypothetical protein